MALRNLDEIRANIYNFNTILQEWFPKPEDKYYLEQIRKSFCYPYGSIPLSFSAQKEINNLFQNTVGVIPFRKAIRGQRIEIPRIYLGRHFSICKHAQ